MSKALNILLLYHSCPASKTLYNTMKTEYSRTFNFKLCKDLNSAIELLASEMFFHYIMVDAELTDTSPVQALCSLLDISDHCQPVIFGETATIERTIMTDIDQELLNEVILLELPIDKQDLINKFEDTTIRFQLLEEEKAIIQADEQDFAPVKLRNFYLFKSIPADTYLKVSKNRFMKIIEKDEPFTQSLIQRYAKRKVRCFHLNKKDQLKLLEDSTQELIKKIEYVSELSEALHIIVQSIGVIQTYLRLVGTSESVIQLTHLIIDKIRLLCEEHASFKKLLKSFPLIAADSSEKSTLTALFCEGILKKMNYKSHATRSKLTLAAILCDATLENEDLYKVSSLEDPNLKMFERDEQESFVKHPIQAGELANLFPSISEVDFIIKQHHEKPDGTGFPSGIHARKITTVSAIFIVANEMATFIVQRGLDPKNISYCLKVLQDRYQVVPFKEPLRGLISSVKQ